MQVPPHFLCLLQNRILCFIWANRYPRVPKSTLFTNRLQGGLGVPNFSNNYSAAQISWLSMLHATLDIPLWRLLEHPNCALIAMQTLFWLPYNLCPSTLSPITMYSMKTCDSVWYSGNLMSSFLPLLPIVNNLLFPPGMEQPSVGGFPMTLHKCNTSYPHGLFQRGLEKIQETHEAPEVRVLRVPSISSNSTLDVLFPSHFHVPILQIELWTYLPTHPIFCLILALYASFKQLCVLHPSLMYFSGNETWWLPLTQQTGASFWQRQCDGFSCPVKQGKNPSYPLSKAALKVHNTGYAHI